GFGGGINLYVYVKNQPINKIDPRGLKETLIAWNYATEYGTTGEGLQENIRTIENTVDEVFNSVAERDAIVTYTINGTHSSGSLHYQGNAIDLRTRDLNRGQIGQATQQLRDSLGNNYDVIFEDDHIHIEYDPN
ncbi:hypothetical protein HZA55_06530, partial [Candidatus Poribacteria bacterium]|nr:hypothetical protein [Candidatus Poribacteria bacterium]